MKKTKKRVIALVDCNNFFVSCERLRNPNLIDKPVCVLSNNDACVVSRSNEAKKMGVNMGAPYFLIKNQFKKVTFLSGDLNYYREISKKIMQKLKDFTPDIEVYSIDEAFLDLTNLNKTFNCTYEEIIKKIVYDIQDEIKIPVSVGLSYSKVLAKLASDKSKEIQKNDPENKTYVIGYRNIENELKNTLIKDVWGIGKNTHSFLKRYLIQSAYEFCAQQDFWLKKNLGKIGLDLKQELLGNSINPVNHSYQAPKSISRSESFSEFQKDFTFIQKELNSHIHKVCKKLREENLTTKSISIFLRTKDFLTFSEKINLAMPTNSEFELINQTKDLLTKIYQKDLIYRSVGFCATKLENASTQQISLFDSEKVIKNQKLSSAWDKLEEKFGKGIITLGKEN